MKQLVQSYAFIAKIFYSKYSITWSGLLNDAASFVVPKEC